MVSCQLKLCYCFQWARCKSLIGSVSARIYTNHSTSPVLSSPQWNQVSKQTKNPKILLTSSSSRNNQLPLPRSHHPKIPWEEKSTKQAISTQNSSLTATQSQSGRSPSSHVSRGCARLNPRNPIPYSLAECFMCIAERCKTHAQRAVYKDPCGADPCTRVSTTRILLLFVQSFHMCGVMMCGCNFRGARYRRK